MADALIRGLKRAVPASLRRRLSALFEERSIPATARNERRREVDDPAGPDPGITHAVRASLDWLCLAQDSSTSADGGVARHFSLLNGWSESYPETTGYIIPTFLDCSESMQRPELAARARRMLDWCLAIQMPDGGFQGGTVNAKPKVSVTFNTGQILLGLAAGAARPDGARYLDAMHRAASFLRDSQDADGAWRRYPTPFAKAGDKTYETHVSWGLFEAERVAPGNGYGAAGLRQARWALTKQAQNGWFTDCCLENPSIPLTHTLGYALRGLVEAWRLSGDAELLTAARRSADGLISAMDQSGRLPGRLDAKFQAAVPWVCLTGSVQVAHSWLLLFNATSDERYLDAARQANAYVRRLVRLTGEPNQIGAVKGSFPIDGEYGRFEYLNWAAKFFVDSNLAEARARI